MAKVRRLATSVAWVVINLNLSTQRSEWQKGADYTGKSAYGVAGRPALSGKACATFHNVLFGMQNNRSGRRPAATNCRQFLIDLHRAWS